LAIIYLEQGCSLFNRGVALEVGIWPGDFLTTHHAWKSLLAP